MKTIIISICLVLTIGADLQTSASAGPAIFYLVDSPGMEKKTFELKLDGLKQLEQEQVRVELKIGAARKQLDIDKPVWQAKADSAAEVAKQIYRDHHNQHLEESPELTYWRTQLAAAVSATNGFMNKADAIQKTYDDLVAGKERMANERFARVSEILETLIRLGVPCAKELDQNASLQKLKHCGNIYFDGADPDLPEMPDEGMGTGTKFFSSDMVIVPEYDKKATEEKQKKIDEMIRESPAPVKRPILVEPPSPDQTRAEPTGTDRLLETLKKLKPKQSRTPTAVSSVRG